MTVCSWDDTCSLSLRLLIYIFADKRTPSLAPRPPAPATLLAYLPRGQSARQNDPVLSSDVRPGRRVGGAGYTLRQGELSSDAEVVVQGTLLRVVSDQSIHYLIQLQEIFLLSNERLICLLKRLITTPCLY